MYHKKIVLLFFLFSFTAGFAQESYCYFFVYLKDKPQSEFNISHPEDFLSIQAIARRKMYNVQITEVDLPVDKNYIAQISAIDNCEIWNKSKWLNAIEIRSKDSSVIKKINSLPFVSASRFLGKIPIALKDDLTSVVNGTFASLGTDSAINKNILSNSDYGDAFVQNSLINVHTLHKRGYLGDGISIAVFDAGFLNAYKTPGMNFDLRNLIVRDFVTHDNSVWEDDKHGANVLSFMKTNDPGTYIGTAPLAGYMLIRTEESASEYPTEEVNWLVAAEFADSMGVDLISSSLGYNIFDDNSLSHTHRELDGKTSIVAKAANIAKSKGIFIVASAGNEGANTWHKIGTPSDANGVIAIGATDNEGTHADFSSYGPSSDGRVKPDFVVMGKKAVVASPSGTYLGNGTSYATPIFAGSLACLIQACPGRNFEEIMDALKQSATHSSAPDSAYGYGIPDVALAALILGNYLGMDTTADIFWQNQNAGYWESQSLHFRSSVDQTIEVRIKGNKKNKKNKTIVYKKIFLKKGEWIHNNDVHTLIAKQSKAKKRKKLKAISLEFITGAATYQRSFTLAD